MRIKINDKIYRLKEIESGVDSLMELVEEPKFKDGDFVYEDKRIMIVKSYPSNFHAIVLPCIGFETIYDSSFGVNFSVPTFRYATEEEKQILIDAMAKDGKRWNAEKKCIEDIPKCKFKKGDKVMLKSGCKDAFGLSYFSEMDEWIGKPITVYRCQQPVFIYDFDDCPFHLHEDWLEPVEELKKGDLAIFWDGNEELATIGFYNRLSGVEHYDCRGWAWKNAIKFEGKEQYEKLINGEL